MAVEDPHRTSGCWFEKNAEKLTDLKPRPMVENWFALLDWAVYHAPEWEAWQEFRTDLVGRPMENRSFSIMEWWESHWYVWEHEFPPGQQPKWEEYHLATAVRVVNLLRSLRGQFGSHPELRRNLDLMNSELHRAKEGTQL